MSNSENPISVAMTTYNGALYLHEQLGSFVKQSRLPDELVVCDDGSTDKTLDILRGFRSTAPFEVKICRNPERLGYSRNFEKAMKLCSGAVIFLSDQDDVWFPNKIERVVSAFVAKPKIMAVINDQILTDEKLAHHGATRLQQIRALGRDDSAFFPGCCTALRREWREASLPAPRNALSYDWWINKLADVMEIRLVLAEPLQFYRLHASNTSQSKLSLAPSRSVSRLHRVRASALQDSRHHWSKERREKELYRNWLEEHDAVLRSAQLEESRERTIRRLDADIRALERRAKLMDLPRGIRAPAVVRFLLEGGYANCSGWKSALNDVLR